MYIVSTANRIGDGLLFLPVAARYCKETGDKIHWLLTNKFNLMVKIENLLRAQDFTKDVTYFDYPTQDKNPNFQHVTAKTFGIEGESFTLCFKPWTRSGKPMAHEVPPTTQYITEYWSQAFEWDYDRDFIMKYPKMDVPSHEHVWIEAANYRESFGKIHKYVPTNAVQLLHSDSIEKNINLAMNSKNVWTTGGGFAAIMDLCGRQVIICQPRWEYDVADARAYRLKHKYVWME